MLKRPFLVTITPIPYNVSVTELILQTKLYLPVTRSNIVPRPQLVARLNAGLEGRLTLVSAPAGFGKTTLVTHWAKQMNTQGDWQFAWLALDENDNDWIRFFTYLIAALQKVNGRIGESTLNLLQNTPPNNSQPIITNLINELLSSEQNIVLALDDYHLIINPTIHEGITFLLENAPPQFHLLLISRADPSFSLARLRARHQVTEIRQRDLRFELAEATQFFNDSMHLELSPHLVEALENRTEGWAAGLQMAALSLQGRSDIEHFIKNFTASHRYVFDYLAQEVLAQRPSGTREFLLQTAVLDRFCADLCDTVINDKNHPSSLILHTLENANLFLIPLDEERRWYRYHHLFADLLRQQLRQEMPAIETVLHSRATDWFAEAGFVTEAIEHALKANEFEQAAALIEPIAHGMAYRMDTYTLGRWVEALPDDLLMKHPKIVYPYAIVLSISRRFEAYQHYLDKTEMAAHANIEKQESQIILGQVKIHQSIRFHLFGEYEQALQYVPQTEKTLRQYGQQVERWELISIVGYATMHTKGDAPNAFAHLNKAIKLGTADEGSIGPLLCNTFTANCYFYRGELHQVAAHLQTAIDAATLPDGTKQVHAVFPSALMARLAYERNQLEDACNYRDIYFPLTDVIGFTTDPVDTIFVATMLPLAQGDSDTAVSILNQCEKTFQTLPISDTFTLRLAAVKALLWLRLGHLQRVNMWADSLELATDMDTFQPIQIFPLLVWVRIRLAQQAFAAADDLLTRLRRRAEAEQLHGIVLETAVLQALSAHHQNNTEIALQHLQTALILAAREGYVRLFLDEGIAMQRLLQTAVKQNIQPNYTTKLLTQFPTNLQSKPTASATDILSPRETEVLQLIAQGFTNKKIAAKLVIAPSTAKRHTINIYNKLNVSNRTEATAYAYQVGIVKPS